MLAAFNAGKENIAKLEPLQAKTSKLETSLSKTEKALSESSQQIEATKAENQKLAEQLATAQSEGKATQSKFDKNVQQCKELKNQLGDQQSKLDGSLGQLKKQDALLAKLKTDYTGLQQKHKELSQQYTDSDKDGVSDANDQCSGSTEGATVDQAGCEPDGDNDGLADARDLCPETPEGVKIDAMGCHSKANIALEGVTFRIATERLTQESSEILDRVVLVLKKFSNLQLEVAGHTDNTGAPNTNTLLSAARAEAVRAYLIEKGISEERLAAKGYGPDEPIASNDTAEGRRANRRVELRRR